ncbi:MAG: Preprotein translocase subunit SecE [Candidatus Saccharibacteria bacterium]|nr:Preprotein translocase subunit SecE [Candidatus Saccharibacteria bacterium]
MQRGSHVPSASPRKNPRIRKSAPTLRQRAEAAQAKAEREKPRRVRKALSKAARPVKRLRIPASRIPKPVRAAGRFLAKWLGWLAPSYFVNAWREVRQVTWPSRRETWRLTGAVFIFATVFGAMVAVVDKLLDIVFKNLVLK